MARQLSGKEVAAALGQRIREQAEELSARGIIPTLAIVRVGENESDLSYERGAIRRCQNLGIQVRSIALDTDISTGDLLEVMAGLNRDTTVHGVLMLRPLPAHLDSELIQNALDPAKDVDGMTDASLAGVFAGKPVGFPPCTAKACMEILNHYGIDCQGKKAAVIGRSLVVGKPLAMMLLAQNATVTVCHTRTADLPAVVREADLVAVAAGRPEIIREEFLRPGQIILDVGIHVKEDGKLCGDVDYKSAEPVVEAITPVPGGVGSVTTSVLAGHVVQACSILSRFSI